ncbi:MAG: hypothetical protein KDA24_01215 [Deltaproteobacteria bacterium]|nr:hypothetical protein [Deltaproteobacteria bacterium]
MSDAPEQPQAVSPLRRQLARGLDFLWPMGPVLALGITLGFWASDRGMRWVPDVGQYLLGVWAVTVLFAYGSLRIARKHMTETPTGLRLRRSMLVLLVLSLAGLAGWVAMGHLEEPTPLTVMPPAEFDRAFELDSATFRELDQGMASLVSQLETADLVQTDRALTADEEKVLLEGWVAVLDYSRGLEQLRIFYEDWYRFDASRAERASLLRSFLLTYAAELALFDHGGRLCKLARQNPNVKKFLDVPHPELGIAANSFSYFSQDFEGTRDQARAIGGAQYMRAIRTVLGWEREANRLGLGWLWTDIEDRLDRLASRGLLDRAAMTIAGDGQLLRRAVRRQWLPTQRRVAEFFGDTKFRRVGWYLIDEQLQEDLDPKLEPGDILLTRKNWYLSNVGLPGFWPHAILYVGSPEKLLAWADDEEVRTALARLEGLPEGEQVTLHEVMQKRYPDFWLRYQLGKDGQPLRLVEAHKPGVTLSTLSESAGDALVAFRPLPAHVSKGDKALAIVEAFRHLGKPYDFDFDFATDHALVCTEVVWRAYRPAEGKGGLDLPVVDVAGRKAIPANILAQHYVDHRGTDDALFELVAFIDVNEEERQAAFSTEEVFLTTPQRAKWSPLKGE